METQTVYVLHEEKVDRLNSCYKVFIGVFATEELIEQYIKDNKIYKHRAIITPTKIIN